MREKSQINEYSDLDVCTTLNMYATFYKTLSIIDECPFKPPRTLTLKGHMLS